MKKEVADKWVEALRSGKYKKGQKQLFNELDNTYCCLGVLCVINQVKPVFVYEDLPQFDGDSGVLSDNLRDRFGMISKNGNLGIDNCLSMLNDDSLENYSFDEIADIIQICYKEL